MINTRALAILVCLAAVALAAFVAWSLSRPAPHILSGKAGPNNSLVYTDTEPYYQISMSYPAKTPLYQWWDPRADDRARLSIESWLKNDAAQFAQDLGIADLPKDYLQQMRDNDQSFAYQATYQQYEASSSPLVSYAYTIYVDTGGAHPNTYFQTFVFDKNGDIVSLADLFKPDSDYLDRLASSSLPVVESQIGQRLGLASQADIEGALFLDGLDPTQDNFQNFVVSGQDLVLFFPPYQVAPYAAGNFEVDIPLSQLSDILNPAWN